jgi:hypothetical protein
MSDMHTDGHQNVNILRYRLLMVAAKNARCLYSVAKSMLSPPHKAKIILLCGGEINARCLQLSNAVKTPGIFRSCDSSAAD